MRIFGWCATNFHCDYEGKWSAPCKGEYRRVVKDVRKQGRKTIERVLVDEMVYCECPCHKGEPVKPVKKPAKKATRRKK